MRDTKYMYLCNCVCVLEKEKRITGKVIGKQIRFLWSERPGSHRLHPLHPEVWPKPDTDAGPKLSSHQRVEGQPAHGPPVRKSLISLFHIHPPTYSAKSQSPFPSLPGPLKCLVGFIVWCAVSSVFSCSFFCFSQSCWPHFLSLLYSWSSALLLPSLLCPVVSLSSHSLRSDWCLDSTQVAVWCSD